MISALPTISEAGQLLRAGRLEPTELVEFCLDRIKRFEKRVRAWVLVDEDGAQQEAARLGRLARQGEFLGSLHGIPIGIKDIIDVRGMPTKAGSRLRADHLAAEDAQVVRQLRRHGAIILGKTVTTEFACFDPPATRNPWNLKHTPGGSSSGSAAAVAMEMCMAALGSQTGGSIIRPASYCGVAGLKPCFGTVSSQGVVPVSPLLDHVGPIARCVDALAAVLGALMDRTPPTVPPSIERTPPAMALIEEYFLQQASPAVRLTTETSLDKLQQAGARIERMRLPHSFNEVHIMHRRIMAAHAAKYHRQQFLADRHAFGPNLAALIEEGLAVSDRELQAALRHRQRFIRDIKRLFSAGVVAVTPSTHVTAPMSLETTGDPKFNSPWSYAGIAAVTIPCDVDQFGMPCGLQLISIGNEFDLLNVATWCEQKLAFDHSPPMSDGQTL